MTLWALVFRSLRFHARSHLGALLGAGVGSAVLVGALVVGDSVRESLRQMALSRLGKTHLALAANDRLFRQELAESIGASLKVTTAPVLQIFGMATTGDADARANRVQVLGVDPRFWRLANETPSFSEISPDAVVLNRALADQLGAKQGESLLFRVRKPSALSQDAPLAPVEDTLAAIRLNVQAVISDSEFGRFSLHASQVPPFNAFVSLETLASRVGATNRANLLLAGPGNGESGTIPSVESATDALRKNWKLADAELQLKESENSSRLELRSSRVFIDSPSSLAAFASDSNAEGVLTYFVNELRIDDRVTPYSMVTAMGAPIVPSDMKDEEILVNQWLADDLGAKPGDELSVTYYVVGSGRNLEEREHTFRVRDVVPMQGAASDPTLMPDFPGLTDAENCRDWDTGFPIDLSRIREKDNEYWENQRGTPKAFVTLAAGQELWGNRFGDLTGIRFSEGAADLDLGERIRQALDPASVGLQFKPIRKMALAASSQSQDFGQLFLGFSFFLIIAALLLMALLFQFGIERRGAEVGTLLALGFHPRQVRLLLLREGVIVALAGGVIGVFAGMGYARAMLYGLSTIWKSAVGTSALDFHASGMTVIIGATAGVLVASATIWIALRRQANQPAHELLSEGTLEGSMSVTARGWTKRRTDLVSRLCLIGAGGLIVLTGKPEGMAGAEIFFFAGSLLLAAGIAQCASLLTSMAGSEGASRVALTRLSIRNATRRRKRSLSTIALLACGSFLVTAIGVFRLDSTTNAAERSSGTGGFALIGEATIPVVHDLNSESGQEWFGLDAVTLSEVETVPFRVLDGEDASCLNLNRAQKPRLLGVKTELLKDRGAFTFARIAEGFPVKDEWKLLDFDLPGSEVPAIGDQASIQWALGKKVGDTLDYTDEEGRTFKVRLVASIANSILQGNLLIAETAFIEKFPSTSGYRMFLFDAPSNTVGGVSKALTSSLRDHGLEVEPAVRRLAAYNAVQNTYLSTFQVLGGLGLLLGSVGLGVVVLRNVLERRSELALMLAVGFRVKVLRWCVLSEHGALLLLGLGIGVLAAIVAVLPAVFAPGVELPYVSLALTLGAVLVSGILCTWVSARLALRGKLLDALRNE